MNVFLLAGFGAVLLAVVIMFTTAGLQSRFPLSLRPIRAFSRIQRSVRLVVEDGTRLHISLGNGNILSAEGASALAGLAILRRLGEITALSDRPPLATTGNGLLNILAQDTLHSAHDAAGAGSSFNLRNGHVPGLSPISYAAAAIIPMRDEQISMNVITGNLGAEVGLMSEAAFRNDEVFIAASDNLVAQAVMFAASQDPLVGEELFTAGAYFQSSPFHTASVLAQDVLRWLVILALLVGSGLKLAGVL